MKARPLLNDLTLLLALQRVVDLVPLLASLIRPREVSNRDDKETVARVGDTSQGIVPSQEGSEDTETAAGLCAGRAWDEVAQGQEKEGEVEGEEQEEESDC